MRKKAPEAQWPEESFTVRHPAGDAPPSAALLLFPRSLQEQIQVHPAHPAPGLLLLWIIVSDYIIGIRSPYRNEVIAGRLEVSGRRRLDIQQLIFSVKQRWTESDIFCLKGIWVHAWVYIYTGCVCVWGPCPTRVCYASLLRVFNIWHEWTHMLNDIFDRHTHTYTNEGTVCTHAVICTHTHTHRRARACRRASALQCYPL